MPGRLGRGDPREIRLFSTPGAAGWALRGHFLAVRGQFLSIGVKPLRRTPVQYASAEITSPALMVPSDRHVMPLMELLMKWTLPSPKSTLTPPGW